MCLVDEITRESREHRHRSNVPIPASGVVVAIECRDRSRESLAVNRGVSFRVRRSGVIRGYRLCEGISLVQLELKRNSLSASIVRHFPKSAVNRCAQTEIVVRHREVKHPHIQIGPPPSAEGKSWKLLRNTEGDEWIDIHGQPDKFLRSRPQVPDPRGDLSGQVHVEIGNRPRISTFWMMEGLTTQSRR